MYVGRMGVKKGDLGGILHSVQRGDEHVNVDMGVCMRVNGHYGPLVTLMCKGSSVKLQGEFQTLIKDTVSLNSPSDLFLLTH